MQRAGETCAPAEGLGWQPAAAEPERGGSSTGTALGSCTSGVQLSQAQAVLGRGAACPRCDEGPPVPMRRELQSLEDKLTRQLVRLQGQSERFMEIMLHPLEEKVTGLEGKQKGFDAQLAELGGGVGGLQDALQMQVRRAEALESRLCKWRQMLEEEIRAGHAELKEELAGLGMVRLRDVATRQELVDVADLLKRELRKLVAEVAPPSGAAATRLELAELAGSLRRELAAVEGAAAGGVVGGAQQELAHAAESVRRELRLLAEETARCDSSASAGMIWELEKSGEVQRRGLAELAERTARAEREVEETRRELNRMREDIGQLKGRGLFGAELCTRAEVEHIAEQACVANAFKERGRGAGTDAPHQVPSGDLGSAVRDLEARSAANAANMEQLMSDAAACWQQTETLGVVVETANMRLDAVEERQRCLRAEVRGADFEDPVRHPQQTVKEDLGQACHVQQAEQLMQRVEALERVGLDERLEKLVHRVSALEEAGYSLQKLHPSRMPAQGLERAVHCMGTEFQVLGASDALISRGEPESVLAKATPVRDGLASGTSIVASAASEEAELTSGASSVPLAAAVQSEGSGPIATVRIDARAASSPSPTDCERLQSWPLPALDMNQLPDNGLNHQVAALWCAIAELADLAGVRSNGLPASTRFGERKATGGTSSAADNRESTDGSKIETPSCDTGEVTAAATAAMVGAVRDAATAVEDCQRETSDCQRVVGSLVEDMSELHSEWSKLATRVASCEAGLQGLHGELAMVMSAATPGLGGGGAEPQALGSLAPAGLAAAVTSPATARQQPPDVLSTVPLTAAPSNLPGSGCKLEAAQMIPRLGGDTQEAGGVGWALLKSGGAEKE
mmetsp:Transcript_104984/g.338544  ORF Transcript_104984/g.338544 Transcript_104984/m.338544 type:complete len:857 (+) Transcript_104984:99-2669(+)